MKAKVISALKLAVRILVTVIRFLSGGRLCSCGKKTAEKDASEHSEQ